MRLADDTVVVTGASSGLGKAMATAFAAEGANVVCASRTESKLEAVAAAAPGDGEMTVVPTDVRRWDDVQNLVSTTVDTYGGLDVFVNNAGVTQLNLNEEPTFDTVAEVPVGVWEEMIRTNLTGAFYCAKAALGEMLPREGGRLIHTSSGHGVSGRDNRAPYVASKFGLEGLAESLALELDGTGVDSLTIRPPSGGVYTERKGEYGRPPESLTHEDPAVIAEPAVRLAAGEGTNGGRYQADADGEGYSEY